MTTNPFEFSPDHSAFLDSIFSRTAKSSFEDDLEALLTDEYINRCSDFDRTQIQESWAWRNTFIARELAVRLIDDKGELNKKALFRSIQVLEKNLHSLGPHRHHDFFREIHLLKILKAFYESSDFSYALKRVGKPHQHQNAEMLVRETLFLEERISITDAHARRATLAALLTSLRQNVGSCFATAPAILIQQEKPLQFLSDVGQLLGTGRLTRVIEGIEYAVPLSVSWGVADLKKPFYLWNLGEKPWETLAHSPGLLAAFEAAKIYMPEIDRDEKKNICAHLLLEAIFNNREIDPFSVYFAEEILRRSLLYYFQISEEDVRDYELRGGGPILMGMAVMAPPPETGKAKVAAGFKTAFEAAKRAFKGMTDNALLKAWEFTIASFAESKAEFSSWNLYASLGLGINEPHSIGQTFYEILNQQIDQTNREMEQSQSQYDHLFAQTKYLEGRVRNASTDRELGWIQAEYQMRRMEINRILSERDEAYERGRKLRELFPFITSYYETKFKEYFQEVYDAEMQDISVQPYDDSPAGFRLLYKHGRANTSLWTLIHNASEYSQALSSFFIATEIELSRLPETEELKEVVSDLVSVAVRLVKTPEFLEASIQRLARAYQLPLIENPLQNLDRVQRKPWAYISGGTMSTLVSCYFGNPDKPKENKRWIENENELLAFLIDVLREMPLSVQKKWESNPEYSLLAYSPTHAYLLKPSWAPFRAGWESDSYTYTWIRDRWIGPQKDFLSAITLDMRMMERLIEEIALSIPNGYRALFKNVSRSLSFSMAPSDFREHLLRTLSYERWIRSANQLQYVADEIDSALFNHLPFFPEHRLREKLEIVFSQLDAIEPKQQKILSSLLDQVDEQIGRYKLLSAKDLRNIAKALLILTFGKTKTPIPFHQRITKIQQQEGFSYPQPILFGDTNWMKNYFGFTVNPGTGQLELWRLDNCGSEGKPMSLWKPYIDGTDKRSWGIYIAPKEYGLN